MKITSTDHLQQLNDHLKPRSLETDQGFSKILDNAKTKGQGTPAESPPALISTPSLMSSNHLGLIMAAQSLGDKTGKVDSQLESTLDKIEKYASALGDTTKNPKEVGVLAQDLGQAGQQLSKLSQGLPEGNPLKSLSNDAAVLATVESMKFKRGDYI